MCVNAFNDVVQYRGGVLCGEPIRGARFDIMDAKLHSDRVHRNVGAIIPAMTKVMYAAQLLSSPTLMEPVYKCTISCSNKEATAGVYQTLRARRAEIVVEDDSSSSLSSSSSSCSCSNDEESIVAYLPVAESFGFSQLLSENTGGYAFSQMTFSHWRRLDGDFRDEKTMAGRIVKEIRKRKGLSTTLPVYTDYHDDIKN